VKIISKSGDAINPASIHSLTTDRITNNTRKAIATTDIIGQTSCMAGMILVLYE
jgi:hypothetical protein